MVKLQATLLLVLMGLMVSFAGTAGPLPRHGLALHDVVYGHWAGLPYQNDPEFGYSVAMDAGWLAVGAPQALVDHGQYGIQRHGAVFLFQREGGQWQYRQTIFGGGYGNSECGYSVAIDVPWLIIGCPGADNHSPSTQAGIVSWYRLFTFNGQPYWAHDYGWNEANGARCGTAVGISNGAPGIFPGGSPDHPVLAYGCPQPNGGAGYVRVWAYDPDTDAWSQLQTLQGGDAANGDRFGASLSLGEDYFLFLAYWLAVGAPDKDLAGHLSNGKVYVFRGTDSPASWSESDSMEPPLAAAYSDTAYGQDVAVLDDRLVIGAPTGYTEDCPGMSRCGYAEYWVYDTDPAPPRWLFGWQDEVDYMDNEGGNPSGPQPSMRYGQAVAISSIGVIAMGAPRTDGYRDGGGAADEAGYLQFRIATTNLSLALGGLRPYVGPYALDYGHFGASLDFGSEYRLAVGAPDSGSLYAGPNGLVYIYGKDRIFRNGFEDTDPCPCLP